MDENLENFDWNYYLENNEDLYLNGINSKEAALNHWINNGINENRPHKFINNDIIVDFKIYIEKFKFLEEKEYIKKEDAWNLTIIIFDKLYNNPYMEDINYFDWKYYIKNNTDLFDNNIISKEDVIEHWNNFGKYENRNHKFTYNILKDIDETIQNYINNINKNDISDMDINMYDMNNFDWKYYIKNNKDLIDGNIFTKEDCINHWNNFGKFEKRLYKFDNDINNELEEKNIIKTYSEKKNEKYEKIEKIKENIKQQNKEIINEKSKEPFFKKHVTNDFSNEKMKEQIIKKQDFNDYVNEKPKEQILKKQINKEIPKEQIEKQINKETFDEKIVNEKNIKEITEEQIVNEKNIKFLIDETSEEQNIIENINEKYQQETFNEPSISL